MHAGHVFTIFVSRRARLVCALPSTDLAANNLCDLSWLVKESVYDARFRPDWPLDRHGASQSSSTDDYRPILVELDGGPRDLPQIAVRVGEISGVAAPERVTGRLDDYGPGAAR